MTFGLGEYLGLASILFGIGAFGFLTRSNVLVQLMSIEVMLNAVNVLFVSFNRFNPQSVDGHLFAFFVIALAAAEAAVGLAIVISLFRIKKTIRSDEAKQLKH